MKRMLVGLLLMFTFAFAAMAHGDKKHVQGRIEKINSDSIVVRTKDGSSIVIKLASSTVFIERAGKTDKAATAGDLAVGDLVVIHATPKETGLEADEVKFSNRGAHGTALSGSHPKS